MATYYSWPLISRAMISKHIYHPEFMNYLAWCILVFPWRYYMWLVDLLKLQHVSWDLYILKQIDFFVINMTRCSILVGLAHSTTTVCKSTKHYKPIFFSIESIERSDSSFETWFYREILWEANNCIPIWWRSLIEIILNKVNNKSIHDVFLNITRYGWSKGRCISHLFS